MTLGTYYIIDIVALTLVHMTLGALALTTCTLTLGALVLTLGALALTTLTLAALTFTLRAMTGCNALTSGGTLAACVDIVMLTLY